MTRSQLTREDVGRLLADTSSEARAETAAKIADDFRAGSLSDSERVIAEGIFRLMVRDAEVRVRAALALNLKESPLLPRDVARTLAADVDEVAMPILEFSSVLSDDDLIEIVRSQDAAKQAAIAGRASVSESLSSALVDTGNEDVVTRLVSNSGATISEQSLRRVVDSFGDRPPVQTAMVHRPRLPVTIAERLVAMVSDNLRDGLARRHELPGAMATDLILQSRERATLTLSTDSSDDELERLVKQLRYHDRLTSSIVLRALCMGDLRFFESALAELAGIPIVNARNLIHDGGSLGLDAIYGRANLPEAQFPAARAAIDMARETDYDGGENDRERYARRMIERVLTQYEDLGVEFESDDLEYLLHKMHDLPADLPARS